jgi:hypothetical protein
MEGKLVTKELCQPYYDASWNASQTARRKQKREADQLAAAKEAIATIAAANAAAKAKEAGTCENQH